MRARLKHGRQEHGLLHEVVRTVEPLVCGSVRSSRDRLLHDEQIRGHQPHRRHSGRRSMLLEVYRQLDLLHLSDRARDHPSVVSETVDEQQAQISRRRLRRWLHLESVEQHGHEVQFRE